MLLRPAADIVVVSPRNACRCSSRDMPSTSRPCVEAGVVPLWAYRDVLPCTWTNQENRYAEWGYTKSEKVYEEAMRMDMNM